MAWNVRVLRFSGSVTPKCSGGAFRYFCVGLRVGRTLWLSPLLHPQRKHTLSCQNLLLRSMLTIFFGCAPPITTNETEPTLLALQHAYRTNSAHRYGGHARHRQHNNSSSKEDQTGVPFPIVPEPHEDQSLPPPVPRKERSAGVRRGKGVSSGRRGKMTGNGRGGGSIAGGGGPENDHSLEGSTVDGDGDEDDIGSRVKVGPNRCLEHSGAIAFEQPWWNCCFSWCFHSTKASALRMVPDPSVSFSFAERESPVKQRHPVSSFSRQTIEPQWSRKTPGVMTQLTPDTRLARLNGTGRDATPPVLSLVTFPTILVMIIIRRHKRLLTPHAKHPLDSTSFTRSTNIPRISTAVREPPSRISGDASGHWTHLASFSSLIGLRGTPCLRP